MLTCAQRLTWQAWERCHGVGWISGEKRSQRGCRDSPKIPHLLPLMRLYVWVCLLVSVSLGALVWVWQRVIEWLQEEAERQELLFRFLSRFFLPWHVSLLHMNCLYALGPFTINVSSVPCTVLCFQLHTTILYLINCLLLKLLPAGPTYFLIIMHTAEHRFVQHFQIWLSNWRLVVLLHDFYCITGAHCCFHNW